MIDLSSYNTLRIPAKAKNLIEINSEADIKKLPSKNIIFLGKGANILFKTDFPGTIALVKITGKNILKETKDSVIVEVGAGDSWHNFVTWTVENGWSGIENLALIPGSVGAAPAGNIGAYGQSADQILDQVKIFHLETGKIQVLSNSDCRFLYRDSIFKHELKDKAIIVSATFRLSRLPQSKIDYYSRHESLETELDKIAKPPYTIKDVYQAVINLRLQKLPDWTKIGTAGSFFKNPFVSKIQLQPLLKKIPDLQYYPTTGMDYPPLTDSSLKASDFVKIPAGRLLDELGWRGKRIGNVGTFEKHALIIVTYPGATGQEVFEFAEKLRQDVQKNFSIDLEYEVVIV